MIRSERAGRALVLGLILGSLPFCGGKSAEPGTSESHFLTLCGAGCASGYACVCGVCTKPCSDDATCHKLSPDAACLAPGATLGCASASLPAKTCDAGCTKDQDCTGFVGGNFSCRSGRCRPPLSCAERSALAEQAINASVTQADVSCTVDQDCVAVPTSSACSTSCGAVLAASASASVQATVDAANNELCGAFSADACTVLTPSCPPESAPVCSNGRCMPADLAAADPTLSSCANSLASPGQSCNGNVCFANDRCCSSYCDSSSPSVSSLSCGTGPTTSSCTAGAPNVELVGVSPFGAVNFRYAWAGFVQGLSTSLSLLFTAASPAVTCDTTRLGLQLISPDGLSESYLGVHWLPIMLTDNARVSVGVARLQIDTLGADQRSPTGSVNVSGDGWDLYVQFSAQECADFSGVDK